MVGSVINAGYATTPNSKYIVTQLKGKNMKYLIFVFLLITVLITVGCVGSTNEPTSAIVVTTVVPTISPTLTSHIAAEMESEIASRKTVPTCTHLSDMKENEIASNTCAIGSDYPAMSTRDLAHPVVGNWSDGGSAIMIYSDGTADVYGFYSDNKNLGTQHATWDVDQYDGNSAKNIYHIYMKNGGIFNFMYYQETDTIDGLHTDERALLIRNGHPFQRLNWK